MLIVWPWTHESYDLSPLLLSGGAGHVADCNKARNQLSPLCILGGVGYLRLGVLIQLQITSPGPTLTSGGLGIVWALMKMQIIPPTLHLVALATFGA